MKIKPAQAGAKRAGKAGHDRRKVIKLIGAGSAAVMTSPWTFQSSRAAPRPIKIGQITPETGPIAAFGQPSQWVADQVMKVLGKGIEVAGERHPVQILNRDSQSDPNRASEVAADLINNENVDIMVASSTSDTTNPVADQCELNGVPCITSDDPWQAWFFGRKGNPKVGFKWTYHFFWGFDQVANMYADMWLTLNTNKKVGVMLTNDPDGIAASNPVHGLPATVRTHGFDVHYLGLYPPLTDDFTAQITQLKKFDCDIGCGIFNPPQFAIFWTQCAQQGFHPKIMTPPKAVLFPTSVDALGSRGSGISTEVWWSDHHPFSSPLTGQTALEFCQSYEKASGKQWTQPLGFKLANLGVAIDVLKRAKKLDANAIRESIADTDYKSIVGRITWKGGPLNPVPNVCTTPLVGGQWEKGKKWKYDLEIVYNKSAPEIPTTAPFTAIKS